jgi:SAM-dependent methyltransferase
VANTTATADRARTVSRLEVGAGVCEDPGIDDVPKLYTDLALWWPLFSAPEDYAAEAAEYRALLTGAADGPVREVLELGSGGGNNASHLTRWFAMTLVDRSPGMLGVSRRLNPGAEHVEGDMRTVRLGRTFDAVFVHDAVTYLTTIEDLARAIRTAFEHCRPGGSTLFCPDWVRETFEPGTDHGGHDGDDGRGVRYVEWRWDPDPADDTYLMDFGYVFRDRDGSLAVEADRHVCGLFAERAWLDGLRDAGFENVRAHRAHLGEPAGSLVFLGRRPQG